MEYEWDEAKSDWTRSVRGFGFDLAAHIFDGPIYEFPDERREYGEERLVTLGVLNGEVLVVVSTIRGNRRRIISARRANRKERELWRLFARL